MLTLFSPTSNLSLGNPWYFYCIHTFVFSRISYSWDPITSVQSLSRFQLFATRWTAAHQAFLSITNSQSLLKLMSIKSVRPSKCLILCRPLLLLPSIFPSIRVSSSESVLCIRWPEYWNFSFSISHFNEYSGLIPLELIWSPCSPRDSQESSPTP